MKRVLLLCFILFCGYHQVIGQSWRRVGSWGNTFSDIQWINNQVGYIAGENIILKSIDSGLSWTELESPTRENIRAFVFLTENRGICLGTAGEVFLTRNGGGSWEETVLSAGEELKAITVFDTNKILIAGTNGTLFLSDDRGDSWERRDAQTSHDIHSLFFTGAHTGYAVTSASELIKTSDGGENWAVSSTGFGVPLNDLHFINDTTGYAVGNAGSIIKTENAGESWQFINSGIDTDLTRVVFHPDNPLIGIIAGKNGTILRTANGGQTFAGIASRTTEPIHAVAFRPQSNNVFAVASSGFLISSTNSGSSWAVRLSGRANDYAAVQFTTDLRGYLVGNQGLILLTTNGGNSFTDRSRPIGLPFNSLFFVNNATGYAAGNNGNIISTTNSGANWTTLNPGTNRNIHGLYFFNVNHGYAVGSRGLITKTENRGLNWTPLISGETEIDLKGIIFFDEETGLTIGEEGLILRSSDGVKWERIAIPTAEDFNAIQKLDDQTAVIVGNNGVAFKTKDKGRTWQKLELPWDADFNDVEFLDESVGFVAGTKGLILKTFDGGDTWERLPTATFQHFTGISFGDLNVGYAVGENGTFYQYTCQVPEEVPVIFGESNICLSQQIYSIQGTEEEGTTYEWRVDGGTILEGQESTRIVVRWDRPGRNAVMVRGQNNCGNGSTTALEVITSVQPDQPAAIQGEGVVCLSSFADYRVDSIPGTEYIWQATGGVVRGGQGTHKITIEWTNLKDQAISVYSRNPCGTGPVSEKPILVITTPAQPSVIEGPNKVGIQEADYEVVEEQDINYQWHVGDGGKIVSGQGTSKVRVSWEKEGDHELKVTPMNACNQGESRILEVNVNLITSLEERNRPAQINIYPNPSAGDVYISTFGIPDIQEILVFSTQGQKIREIKPEKDQYIFQIRQLPKGLFTVILRSRTSEYKKKIIIQ
ncbi:YCF48-related protein [Negadavirga shengliensis]|uniref:YCF48-related protein n=1 Tax=Negadavirga shengliensis TaxID=1389218 RepID=A0ABV9T1W6_9BACT